MQVAAPFTERGWGHMPIFTRGGGSIPVVAELTDRMGIPVMMGYGLTSTACTRPTSTTASRCSNAASRQPLSTWKNWPLPRE